MRNKRQFVGAFVIAAVLGSAMPLSADMGGARSSTCATVLGMAEKALPDFVVDLLWAKWCSDQQQPQ